MEGEGDLDQLFLMLVIEEVGEDVDNVTHPDDDRHEEAQVGEEQLAQLGHDHLQHPASQYRPAAAAETSQEHLWRQCHHQVRPETAPGEEMRFLKTRSKKMIISGSDNTIR